MHRAPTLLGVVLTAIPAFASDPTSVREYAERCANYYARQYGVSPALVRAVIQVESAWQPGVVSAKGASVLFGALFLLSLAVQAIRGRAE